LILAGIYFDFALRAVLARMFLHRTSPLRSAAPDRFKFLAARLIVGNKEILDFMEQRSIEIIERFNSGSLSAYRSRRSEPSI